MYLPPEKCTYLHKTMQVIPLRTATDLWDKKACASLLSKMHTSKLRLTVGKSYVVQNQVLILAF